MREIARMLFRKLIVKHPGDVRPFLLRLAASPDANLRTLSTAWSEDWLSGHANSYWIAYRACRNLVKADPVRVMDLLRVDEYSYKKRICRRTETSA